MVVSAVVVVVVVVVVVLTAVVSAAGVSASFLPQAARAKAAATTRYFDIVTPCVFGGRGGGPAPRVTPNHTAAKDIEKRPFVKRGIDLRRFEGPDGRRGPVSRHCGSIPYPA